MYNGGKNGSGVYQTIINLLPPHKTYIEAFLGSGAILNNKKPAERNIGIEINPKTLHRFWRGPAPMIEVIEQCAINYLQQVKNTLDKNCLVYADPPYPLFSRKGLNSRLYDYELTDQQHIEFLTVAKQLKCNVIISSYPNTLYDELLSNWEIYDFTANTQSGPAIERLYMNYPTPKKLHEYTYLGSNRTERQRIKEKIRRNILKLMALPALEREAILQALQTLHR